MKIFKSRPKESDPDEENSVDGERELSSVNKGITLQSKIINWAVICFAVALAALLLYKYYSKMYTDYQNKAPTKDATRMVATNNLPPLVMPDPETAKVPEGPVPSEVLPPLQQTPPGGVNGTGQQAVKSAAQLAHERRLKSVVRFNLDGHAPGAAAPSAVEGSHDVATVSGSSSLDIATDAGAGAEPDAGAYFVEDPGPGPVPSTVVRPAPAPARAIRSANFTASRAFMLPDPTLMMTRGKVIPCTVLPAMDTTLTGIVTCITGEDATGADNKVSLMDRGTICAGKQGGGVTQGQRRVGIIWDRCETPQHVLVPLDAGATDRLGRPGIPGRVDNHFWDRFGGAIALSLITDIGPYLIATKQGGSNNTTVAFPSITGPQQVMSDVLKSTVDIPPTVTGPQGAPVLIYLAGDIDFRDVYKLERTRLP